PATSAKPNSTPAAAQVISARRSQPPITARAARPATAGTSIKYSAGSGHIACCGLVTRQTIAEMITAISAADAVSTRSSHHDLFAIVRVRLLAVRQGTAVAGGTSVAA